MNIIFEELNIIDKKFLKCYIDLDFGGYFIIFIDKKVGFIFVKYFINIIDSWGLVIDLEIGKFIFVKGKVEC